MAGCYCPKAFTASPCVYQPALTVLGGSFAGSTSKSSIWTVGD